MKAEVRESLELVELAERVVVQLDEVAQTWTGGERDPEARQWLATAADRIRVGVAEVRARLDQGLALPELKALRLEHQRAREQAWVAAVRRLHDGLRREVGTGSPLFEALFAQVRLEKLERGGAALRTPRAELEGRRGSAYVRRLSQDPAYPFLPGLLVDLDGAAQALDAFEASANGLDESALEGLRAEIAQAGTGLARALRQARALTEAAFVDEPERAAELVFEPRARKRGARGSTS